jgi:aldose 1-epimerase
MSARVSEKPFGKLPDGSDARLITFDTAELQVSITDFGGRMVSIETVDRHGERGEILLGFDDVAAYASAGGAFGALLGRNANRIAHGQLVIDGRGYELSKNDGGSTLHGGARGFEQVLWQVRSIATEPTPALVLSYQSPDGDQGFPGCLSVQATYRLDGTCLWLLFSAQTTQPTVVSLSAHPYFNLAGPGSGDVLGQLMNIRADHFLPTDERQIPTGEILPVTDTPFDFRNETALGARISRSHEQLVFGLGYDHYYVLPENPEKKVQSAARAVDAASGRTLELSTTQPGLQLYTGNKLNGRVTGRGGAYRQSAGFALEPQGYPDAPHHPQFPSTILRPGTTYHQSICYRFGVVR